ncbi:MAG: NUDIX hydrolase [Anaerolineales bacterium]|nr:NUDIX hydrolase [Anaerolineales bacterium]
MSEPLPWRVLQSETLVDFSPWLRVIRQTVQLPNGAVIPDYVLTPGRSYSLVVALTDDDQVLLVRQYKHGVGRPVFDFPAGYLTTPDEAPLTGARRELLEETGYVAGRWTSLGAYVLDTNRADTAAHLFLAEHLTLVAAPHLDETEALTTHPTPRAEIMPLLRNGGLPNIACAAAWGLTLAHLAERAARSNS